MNLKCVLPKPQIPCPFFHLFLEGSDANMKITQNFKRLSENSRNEVNKR